MPVGVACPEPIRPDVAHTDATLGFETGLWAAGHRSVCSLDEVGRGSLAGPAVVGAVMVTAGTPHLAGLRDSKLLSKSRRETIAPRIREWAAAWSVGQASATEIDELGIIGALGLAARRAVAGLGSTPDIIVLDGDRDYVTPPGDPRFPPVLTQVKADMTVASCAAASILAKVHRDTTMTELHEEDPRWAWASNSGYGSPAHLAALAQHGPGPQHRKSFRLPVMTGN